MEKIIARDKQHIRDLIFKQNVNACDIDVSNVTDMCSMFYNATNMSNEFKPKKSEKKFIKESDK